MDGNISIKLRALTLAVIVTSVAMTLPAYALYQRYDAMHAAATAAAHTDPPAEARGLALTC